MEVDVVEEHVLRDEVIHWVYDHNGYYACTAQGLTLNIVQSASIQPRIEREDDYFTYLWMETLQGFFLARQRIVESSPQPWLLVRQVVPRETYQFFRDFQDTIDDWLRRLDPLLAAEDAAHDTGDVG